MKQLRKPVHPGKVFLLDVLVPLRISVTDAAYMMGITRKTLSEFVNEKSSCSPQMALRIATRLCQKFFIEFIKQIKKGKRQGFTKIVSGLGQ